MIFPPPPRKKILFSSPRRQKRCGGRGMAKNERRVKTDLPLLLKNCRGDQNNPFGFGKSLLHLLPVFTAVNFSLFWNPWEPRLPHHPRLLEPLRQQWKITKFSYSGLLFMNEIALSITLPKFSNNQCRPFTAQIFIVLRASTNGLHQPFGSSIE